MFTLFAVFLCGLYVLGRTIGGPLYALAIAWIISCCPLILNIINYRYFDSNDVGYILVLAAYLTMFALGAMLAQRYRGTKTTIEISRGPQSVDRNFAHLSQIAEIVWYVSVVAMAVQIIDFMLLGGATLDDFATLRDVFQAKASTPLTLIANVTTWSCLYCFAYAIFCEDRLGKAAYRKYLIPSVGYFLVAVLSAGRQAAFQIMLFSIILGSMPNIYRLDSEKRISKGLKIAVISILMMSYMGFVAIIRNDGAISIDKINVLRGIFDFELSANFDLVTSYLGQNIAASLVEAIVYFSSSISLFSQFLLIDDIERFHSYGAMTFPFLMRQLEPITGISVIGALQTKMNYMSDLGVIGGGWTTGFSSYILDFGFFGAAVVIFLMGFYSQKMWHRARSTGDFHDVIVSTILTISAIYTPFLLASAETNLFLLWLFCLYGRFKTANSLLLKKPLAY